MFHISTRREPFSYWEPVYVGAKNDPSYDERLTSDGRRDKMTQVRETYPYIQYYSRRACRLGVGKYL